MNDERLLHDLGSWLKDTDTARPDAERITARAMSQVPQVRQRGRWWPLPALDRGSPPAPASGSTVFSALRFVAAGIIIGLFGGFLLASILSPPHADRAPAAATDSPAPMTTEKLLSTAVTEEVEPGVVRVIDDGIRDLAAADTIRLVSGRDGSIWLLSGDHFLRVGADGTSEWPVGLTETASEFEVAPDGTIWIVGAGEDGVSTIWSFDDARWTRHGPTSDTRAIEIADDGTVWAFWQDQGSETVSLGHLAGGERQPIGEWHEGRVHGGHLYLSGSDDVWVAGAPAHREGKPELYRLVDGTLQQEYAATVVAADVGADGTAWFVSLDELIRLDRTTEEAEPESWALPGSMTAEWGSMSRWTFLPGDAFRAAPDGSIWFALRADSGPPVPEVHCAGIAGFDGTTWLGPFLQDRCVESIELAADGSVWLLARDAEGSGEDLVDLFVVTPEAVASPD
jgi:hypothetical protein